MGRPEEAGSIQSTLQHLHAGSKQLLSWNRGIQTKARIDDTSFKCLWLYLTRLNVSSVSNRPWAWGGFGSFPISS